MGGRKEIRDSFELIHYYAKVIGLKIPSPLHSQSENKVRESNFSVHTRFRRS